MKKFRISEEQLALPFERARNISISYEDRQKYFWFLAGIAVLSIFIYFYAISATARNTALRENMQAHLSDAGSRIGALEFSYVALKNAVTYEKAHELGFKEAENPVFVTRTTDTSLTLNR
ncbi:MAG: hypothetical protein A2758_02570 [Candidatus Zambryskibacteria bacterium RIFCSPHIGHO2_01_FULL_49_18]|uniref:Uncharacterized protein n=2 Tax=Candidatus Zambryskiibacteriota TaxID=1817925 RepID=A0A1G2T201_9BACT|nr:MAG: hypothetical protein A2758_02570 [Candidatus Zambryskibacteria bacterium RIFCSPHIGHO2_01_FULL_49_18]OHB06201.1 MAG: hypothetical protein A3A26_01530 [Candidatus Zambryskibacteria bacterium RIFCSPLOWO2_01_FULL_47_14]